MYSVSLVPGFEVLSIVPNWEKKVSPITKSKSAVLTCVNLVDHLRIIVSKDKKF